MRESRFRTWKGRASAILLAAILCHGGVAAEGPEGGGHYAIAIHGGAGVISRTLPEKVKQEYLDGLTRALATGRDMLRDGARSLDVVEEVVRILEDDPHFNAGRGAVLTRPGEFELDASIMDGRTLGCGAVGGVRKVRHPISLARLVMERTPHVLLAGRGADRLAAEMGLEQVPQSWFETPRRREQWKKAIRAEREAGAEEPRAGGGTVGAVALDLHGDLAAATSTGGTTAKLPGRLGDTPIPGAGTYADNRTCAVSGTGKGEEFIRHAVAHRVAALMEMRGLSADEAAVEVMQVRLRPGDGGVIVVGADGSIAMVYNTDGMFRGAADSAGRFEVRIWE